MGSERQANRTQLCQRETKSRERGSASRMSRGDAPVSSPSLAQKLCRAHRIPVTLSCPVTRHAGRSSTEDPLLKLKAWPSVVGERQRQLVPGAQLKPLCGKDALKGRFFWGEPALPQGEPQKFFQSFPLSRCQVPDPYDCASSKEPRGIGSRS